MRQLVWIKTAKLEAWGCSTCAWTFRPTGPPVGRDLEEMKLNFERQRDREFGIHVCSQYPKDLRARGDSILPRQFGERNAYRRTASTKQIQTTGAL